MFKKTLAGLAVAGLFSGAAMAADVNVYGVVDLGLMYNHNGRPTSPTRLLSRTTPSS